MNEKLKNLDILTETQKQQKDKLALLSKRVKTYQKQTKLSTDETIDAMKLETSEEKQALGKRLEKLELDIADRTEMNKVKRYIRILQKEFLEKVKHIDDVFSEDNKQNFFASIFRRLSELE